MSSFFRTSTHFSITKFALRSAIFFTVCITAFTGPWWISFGIATVFIFFSHSYELLLGGLILDTIFAQGVFTYPVGDFIFTSLLLTTMSFSWMLARHVQGIHKV